MKSKLIRIITVLLALIIALALMGCDISDFIAQPGGGTNQGGSNNSGSNNGASNNNGSNNNGGGTEEENGGSEGGNTDVGGTEEEPEPEIEYDPDKFQLVRDGVAQFNFVITNEAGPSAVRTVDKLISYLRGCDVDVNDKVLESVADAVTDYEIIVGTGARNRYGTLSVSDKYLGKDGYTIQSFGTKLVIAGGTQEKTKYALNLFIDKYLGIDMESDEPIVKLEFEKIISEEVLTEYEIESITLADDDFSRYSFYMDTEALDSSIFVYDVYALQDRIYNKSGYWISVIQEEDAGDYSKKFIIRYTNDAGEDGFRAYVKGRDFIVECAYANCFATCLDEFMDEYIFSKTGDVVIPEDISYTKHVSTVKYSDFGAVGDGETDDYQAIYDAHEYANAGGQKVYADEGAVYYLNYTPRPIIIQTDVDFGNARFIIDDRGSEVYSVRKNPIFRILRDHQKRTVYETIIEEYAKEYDIALKAELYPGDLNATTSMPWLREFLDCESMIRVYNTGHNDFIRHGSNQNSGSARTDVLIVNEEGEISSDTPVAYDFDNITKIEIYRMDDKPITVNGGTFETISCRTVVETDYKNKWEGYKRGFNIERANVTLSNIDHIIVSEAALGDYQTFEPGTAEYEKYHYEPDDLYANYGSRREGYAYNCFLFFTEAINATLKDSTVQGHTTYYEEKMGTETDGSGGNPADRINYVAQGTYDFVMEYSIGVTFDNVKQDKETLTNTKYWGIMSSNGSKNLTFQNGCEISRFDAHRGVWNATLTDTTIGHTFHVVGGGKLHVERVKVMRGNDFMKSRSDYGSTFRGDIYVKDSVLEAFGGERNGPMSNTRSKSATYVFRTNFSHWKNNAANTGYLNWDFGYKCYMPVNITLDNFKSNGGTLYLFEDIRNLAFDSSTYSNSLNITQSITYKNMNKLKTCPSAAATGDYSKMYSIPVK